MEHGLGTIPPSFEGMAMKQFMYGLAVGLAVVAPASAMNFYGGAPNITPPTVAAGSVSADGAPTGGSGFTVSHSGTGRYEIHFRNNRMRGCATMVASPQPSLYVLSANTIQIQCGQKFDVYTGYFDAVQGRSILEDGAFSFTVVQQ